MNTVLNLIQSTEVEGRNGLLDSFLLQLQQSLNQQVFTSIQVIVPNHAYVNYLKNIVAKRFGIYANIDFVVLPGPVLQNIYCDNNPNTDFIDFSLARFVIYEYLCKQKIDSIDAVELNQYIYTNESLDNNKVFALATELGTIFQEYIYLRTDELLNSNSKIYSTWQGTILNALLAQDKKSFLDIYKFFMQNNLDKLELPKQIFIFGLTSIYPAQLKLLKQIGTKTKIYWYYHSSSYEYYGDLLSDKTKSKLQQKLLASPNLSLDDLYLDDGNRIISNLAQQSREFIELLYANDINIINLNESSEEINNHNSILAIMQNDIKTLKYRIKPELRLSNNVNFYQNPLDLTQYFTENNKILDLNNSLTSIKINSCHNSMREVQVMYNEICHLINMDSSITLDRILICAPQIENYVQFIEAVFDNEYIVNKDNNAIKMPYNITGVQQSKDLKVIELLLLCLKAPRALNANYLIEILVNSTYLNNMDMSQDNIEIIKKWIYDNNIFFGYDAKDYEIYGYTNYAAHSFDQLIKNLTIGLFIPEDVFNANDLLPIVKNDLNGKFCPYDNIEGNQIELANKLILTINLLKTINQFFYAKQNEVKLCNVSDIINLFIQINDNYIRLEEDKLILAKLIKHLQSIEVDAKINLEILIIIIAEFIDNFKSKVSFKGVITCTSFKNIRNIPFDYIYVLGLNFGEFPQSVKQKYLSMLNNNNWHIGDINYNVEDKQAFLDLFLSAQKAIFFSYQGKNEVDNTDLSPSPILNLIMSTLTQSFINFAPNKNQQYNLYNLFEQHALHPFYNNSATNFSKLWHDIAQNTNLEFKNQRWDFKNQHLSLSNETINELLTIKLNDLCYTFLFTNNNIYKALNLKNYASEAQIQDYEANVFYNRDIATKVATVFEKYPRFYQDDKDGLCEFLIAKGLLEYNHWGQFQFNLYVMLFDKYLLHRGANLSEFKFTYKLEHNNNPYIITIEDKIRFEDDNIILINDFKYIYNNKGKAQLNLNIKIKAIILKLLLQNGLETTTPIKNIIVKSFSLVNGIEQYIVPEIPNNLLDEILTFYLNSINTPVLVHKWAIDKYLEAKAGKKVKTSEEIYTEVKNTYEGDFNNKGLEQLNKDIIFAEVADEYFDFVEENNMQNDILTIAKMLECTNLIG